MLKGGESYGPHRPTRVILLDIDGTLIKEAQSWPFHWTGKGVEMWQQFCEKIRKLDKEAGTYTAFGIATFKPEFLYGEERGDTVSDMVLAECGQPEAESLKSYLDQTLIFFTNQECKVQHALEKVRQRHGHLQKADIWILDDNLKAVIVPSQNAGYRAFYAEDFTNSPTSVSAVLESILAAIKVDNSQDKTALQQNTWMTLLERTMSYLGISKEQPQIEIPTRTNPWLPLQSLKKVDPSIRVLEDDNVDYPRKKVIAFKY